MWWLELVKDVVVPVVKDVADVAVPVVKDVLVSSAGVSAAALAALIIYGVVKGVIDRKALEKKMYEESIKAAILTLVDTCDNRVRFEDLEGSKKIELKGDGISSELRTGQKICVS